MAAKNNNKLDKSAADREIREMFGFVPQFENAIPEASAYAHWAVQRDLELSDTVLDHKTKELIGLAVAAHIKCQYCTYFHTKAAKTFGATDEELREAVAIAGMTNLYSNSLNGMNVDLQQFRKDTDRAIEAVKNKVM